MEKNNFKKINIRCSLILNLLNIEGWNEVKTIIKISALVNPG
jgi:hypothetical protein